MKKAIIFDVWSSFGYFRKPYTTTTALTYPFIPRSAVEGLIAAIVGLDSVDYPDKLASSKIAVGVLNKIRKLPFSISYTHSDYWNALRPYLRNGGIPPAHIHAPRRVEFLCEPKYRIYFSCEEKSIMQDLTTNLDQKKTVFTPYLGTSNMLANFQSVYLEAEYENVDISETKPVPVSSIIPFQEKMPKVFVSEKGKYAIEQSIPSHITSEREPSGFYSAIFNPNGGEILASGITLQRIKTDAEEFYVSFIPTIS